MERRGILAAGAPPISGLGFRGFAFSPPHPPTPNPETRTPRPPQAPTPPGEVSPRRLARAQQELQARKVDLLIATPGTNYESLTGYTPGRSERLIALLLPASGDPTIVWSPEAGR